MASFFENQQLARRNTKLLVLMYALAVIGVILAVDLVLGGLYAWSIDTAPGARHLSMGARFSAVVPIAPHRNRATGTALKRAAGERCLAPGAVSILHA